MVMNLYRNIDRSKVQFDFIIHTNDKCDYDDEILSLGGVIHNIPQFNGKNFLQYKMAWHRFFKSHSEYKIIHGHVRSTASIYLWIAKRYGLITIAHSHSTSSGVGISAFVKNILQYPIRYIADYLIACSKSAGQWLFGEKVLKRNNFIILKNAIDSQQYTYDQDKRLKIRKELHIEDKFVIGHVGRFNNSKNHDLLIDIFNVVHNREKKSILMMVGDGELRPNIEKKISDLGLMNSVIFLGVRPDIPELLQSMDCFLFPSIFEGLGIVAIEAQAAGLPCLVSNSIPEETYITDLIESLPLNCSLDQWAEWIILHSNNSKRENMTEEVKRSGYDIHHTVQSVQNFYLEKCSEL
ncbi:glycosyltransferase family 1 protein [Paenibacillus xylanilyticus]|uniref:Glycosyltransferase family 1 protein n=2 Tax=Paenibacillus xylanilyticus TaxID=248903 RepID=A0A7Y6BVN4_9BACL|nr:glycosyltransferase family 1 protein [Paenibacillus xylanilyticus]